MLNRCGSRFIIGDGDFQDDITRFVPFDSDGMKYNENMHTYDFTDPIIKNTIGDLKGDYENYQFFLDNQRDILLEWNYANPNDPQGRTSEFKVARTAQGREAFKKAFIAQVRYADIDGDDMEENEGLILSPRAKNILLNMFNFIGARNQVLLVNPDETADNGYRNGY
jgi:hypothetical protein